MGIFDVFKGDEGWLLPLDSLPAGPYREVVMAIGDFPTNPSTLEHLAATAGFRLMNVREMPPQPGWEGYYLYAGVITSDIVPRQLMELVTGLSLYAAVAKKKTVGIVEQSALETAWVAGNTAGSAGEKLVDDLADEMEDITSDLSQEVDKALEKGSEALRGGTTVQVDVPWNKVLLVGVGIAALIWFSGRRKKS